MASKFRPFVLLAALLVASLAVGVGRPASAALPVPDAGTALPDGYWDMAVDNTLGHVFVSSALGGTVTVLDFNGIVIKRLTGLARPGEMLIDGSTLYVVSNVAAGAVEAYDTRTFVLVGRYGVGKLVDPGPLAMAGGKLWTSTGTCGQWGTKLASVDLSSKAVQVYDIPGPLNYCIGLADAPHDRDQLVAWTDGLQPASTFRLDVRPDGAPVAAVERRQEVLGNPRQLAVTPDEESFVAAPADQYEVGQFRISDQTQEAMSYRTGLMPNAVTVTGARGGLLAVGLDAPYDHDIDVFALGDPRRRVFRHDFGGVDDTLYRRGLAFSSDGLRLFAVSGDHSVGTTWFHVFLLPPEVSLSVDLATSIPGQAVTFSAEVKGAGAVEPTGTVTFLDAAGVLGTTGLGEGKASITVDNLAAGVHQVMATYSGDGMFGPSRSPAVVHTVGASLLPSVPGPNIPGGLSTAAAGAGGYWLLSRAGDVYPFGDARPFGSQAAAAAALEPTPGAGGYWILSRSGSVYAKGDAPRLGDAALAAGERAVSLSATPSGRGYWVFTDRGRVFNFGDAPHRGDMAGVRLNGPVLGSVATPTGQGYWMVASDGGIFAFGDAVFAGSMGGHRLNRPVMSMAPDPDGSGYWLVASDGGIFAFGASFYGSTGSVRLNRPIAAMVPGKGGYLMVAEDGGIFVFGDVPFHGSLGASPPEQPIVAVALTRNA